MANWKKEIDLVDVFAKYESSEIDDSEMIASLHKAFTAFIDANPQLNDLIDFYRFSDAVDELSMVDEVEDADYALQSIYDFADDNRIWIKTF
jgi:hypothetical protein